MNNRKQTITFWVSFTVFSALFFLVKFGGPHLVTHLYQQENLQLLNAVAQNTQSRPVEFYIGRMEEEVFGPLGLLISGVLFMVFALTFLKEASLRRFSFFVFVYFLITKFEILFNPPYGDAIGGPFVEAIWLFRHSFDYAALAKEPIYIEGGPQVYLYSIYPTYLAVLMKIIANTKAFLLVNHTLVFAMSAMIVGFMREIFQKVYDKTAAVLGAALILSLPLFQAQTEAINMEIPVLFFSVMAIHYLIQKKLPLACLMVALATLVKGVAILIGATVAVSCIFMFFMDEKYRFKKSALFWSLTAFVIIGLNFYISVYMVYQGEDIDMVGRFAGWPSIKEMEVLYLFGASAIVFVVNIVRHLLAGIAQFQTQKGKIQYLWSKYSVPFIMMMVVVAWFGLFLNSYAVSPRYRLLLAPFSTFAILYAISLLIPSKKIFQRLLAAVTAFSFFCGYGLLYKPASNNYVLLERSLEYRIDHRLIIDVAQRVEDRYAHFRIGAPFLVAQTLALPELGYVEKKLNVMIYGMKCTYGGIENFHGLVPAKIPTTLWVGLTSDLPDEIRYPVDPVDQILAELWFGDKKATLFLGGFAIERVRQMIIGMERRGMMKKMHP